MYRFIWDVWFDWGLGRPWAKHRFLRNELMYGPSFHYYLAIVINFFLRFIWVAILLCKIYLGNLMNQEYMLFLIAFAEIFRRFIWNLYRLENEHLNNCGQFRVVDDIPLPFTSNNPEDDDDDEGFYLNGLFILIIRFVLMHIYFLFPPL